MSFFKDRISSYAYTLLNYITGKKLSTIKKYFQRNDMSVLKPSDFKYYLEISYIKNIENEKYQILWNIFNMNESEVSKFFIKNNLDINKKDDLLKFKEKYKKLL